MWERIRRLLTGRTKAQDEGREADTGTDPAEPNRSESYVGRASGDDGGYAEETGAERRSEER